jgi:agmatine deiminase
MIVRPSDAAEPKLAGAGKFEILELQIDDSWARDSGPTFVTGMDGRAAVSWQFNAWGNKYHPYGDDASLAARLAHRLDMKLYLAPMVCEGGAIHVDGEGTLLACEQTLLNVNRNPELSQQEVEEILALYTGVRKIVWLGEGFSDDETDGHVDNIACFAAPGRVLVGVPSSKSHPDAKPVQEVIRRLKEAHDAHGRRFEIIEIAQPRKLGRDIRGRTHQASYINFYLCNGGVVMPGFDDPNDEQARETLAQVFPGRDILQVEAIDIVEGGGGIHCITQQEPA